MSEKEGSRMTPRPLVCLTSAFGCLSGEYWEKTWSGEKGYRPQEFEAVKVSSQTQWEMKDEYKNLGSFVQK